MPDDPLQPAGEPDVDQADSAQAAKVRKPNRRSKRPRRKGPKWWRFTKWSVRLCVLLSILVVIIVLLATRGPIARYVVTSVISRQTGGNFVTSEVRVDLDGRVLVDRWSLVVPGIPGLAGVVAQADKVVMQMDWQAASAGVWTPTQVSVERPVIRMSLDRKTNAVNFSGLKFGQNDPSKPSSPSQTAPLRLPRIDIKDGTLQLAEHDGTTGDLTTLVALNCRGWISPTINPHEYLIYLRATNPLDTTQSINITGTMNLETGTGQINAKPIELARWGPELVPSAFRETWDELRVRGKLAPSIRVLAGGGIETTLDMQDVALRVPIASGRPEITGSRRPVMDSVTGVMRITQGTQNSTRSRDGIEADLTGNFEDLPARVRLNTEGLSLESPYHAIVTAKGFRLEKEPRLLWFTPPIVRKNFDRFGGPTGLVDARIDIRRLKPEPDAPAGTLGQTAIAGTLILQDGTCAFDKFPYPLTNVSGTIRFDDDRVQIVGMQGRGLTGAKLFAEGVLEPPSGDAKMQIEVTAADLPLDQYLWESLNKSKGRSLVKAVFNSDRLVELRDKGLVADPQFEGPLAQNQLPFDFTGMVDSLSVRIQSDYGAEQPTRQLIEAKFRNVGILAEVFPYPILASDLTIRVGDDYAQASGKNLRGLNGGSADVDAFLAIKRLPGQTDWSYEPTVSILARQLPIDPLLINAIPEDRVGKKEDAAPDPEVFSVRSFLTQMGILGAINADVKVMPQTGLGVVIGSDGLPPTALLANLDFANLIAKPMHVEHSSQTSDAGGGPVFAKDLVGSITVTEQAVTINVLEGHVASTTLEGSANPADFGYFRIEGTWNYDLAKSATNQAADGQLVTGLPSRASGLGIELEQFDLKLSIEDLVRPIAKTVAETISQFRQERKPLGQIDGKINIVERLVQPLALSNPLDPHAFDHSQIEVVSEVSKARNLSIALEDQRVDIDSQRGSIDLTVTTAPKPVTQAPSKAPQDIAQPESSPPPTVIIGMRDLAASLSIDGQRVGYLEADGAISPPSTSAQSPTSAPTAARPLIVQSPVRAVLRDVLIDSSPVRSAIKRFAGEKAHEKLNSLNPQGQFDAEVRLTRRPDIVDSPQDTSKPQGPLVWAAVRPVWFAMDRPYADGNDERFVFSNVSGEISLQGQDLKLSQLTVQGDGWDIIVNGQGAFDENGSWQLDAAASMDSSGLPADLLALLPAKTRQALDDAKLKVNGPVSMRTSKIIAASTQDLLTYNIDGVVTIDNLLANPGVELRDFAGKVQVIAQKLDEKSGTLTLNLQADKLRVIGLLISQATGKLVLEDGGAVLKVPHLEGNAYGGRLSIRGTAIDAKPSASDPSQPAQTTKDYDALIQLSGVRFADILAEVSASQSSANPQAASVQSTNPASSPSKTLGDASRGSVEATIALRGNTGDSKSMRAQGSARIAGGQAVIDLPGIVTVLQVWNLQLPTNHALDFAHSDFYISNRTITFERILLLSDPLAIVGSGTMSMDDTTLDLSLVSQSRARVPLLSDLMDGIRNELATARVTGTLKLPKVDVEPLTGIGKTLRILTGKIRPTDGLPTISPADLQEVERDRQRILRHAQPRAQTTSTPTTPQNP